MSFISLTYALFLIVILGIYWCNRKSRILVILVASFIFYSSLQISYIPFLFISVIFNYYLAQSIGEPLDWRIANQHLNRQRSFLLGLGILINVFVLFCFKYLPFLFNSIGNFYEIPLFLEMGHWVETFVIPPLGISFFSFECIAYLIDVYRGAPAATSLLNFAAYKFFFPKLISGPITRYHHFNYELKYLTFPSPEEITEGLWLIATGAVKKALIADNLGNYVNLIFNNTNLQRAGSVDLWLGTLAYGLQLYLDFSGYVDLACGSALLMGLKLPQNFNYPYFSCSIADFWRRWHMTLGDWLRNYLYFPLGGSRVKLWRTCLNLLIVMLIAGIWHGAAWGFIIWGWFHGVALVIHRLTETLFQRLSLQSFWSSIPGIILAWSLTQFMVFTTWIFFRLPDLKNSTWVISHLWNYPPDIQFVQKVYLEALQLERFQLMMILFTITLLMSLTYLFHRGLKLELNWSLKLMLVPIFLFAVLILAPQGGTPYIYFDF